MRLRPRTVTVRDWIYVMFYEYVRADKYWYEEEVLCPLFMAIRESVHFHIFIVRTQEVRDGGRGCVCVCEYIQMVVRILNDFRSERQDNNNSNNNTKQALRDKTRPEQAQAQSKGYAEFY